MLYLILSNAVWRPLVAFFLSFFLFISLFHRFLLSSVADINDTYL